MFFVVFIRKGLVITQFTVSVILIISIIIVYRQVQHIENRDFGYNKNKLIYMDLQGSLKSHFSEIKKSLIETGYVENAATSLHDALRVYSYGSGYTWPGKDPNLTLPVHSNVVSSEYISTMDMKLMVGRDFFAGNIDTNRIIINASMVKLMGKEGRVGNIITSGPYKLTIVGIIKDFIYNDVYGSSAPLILVNGGYAATVMAVRFKPEAEVSCALKKTPEIMKNKNPVSPSSTSLQIKISMSYFPLKLSLKDLLAYLQCSLFLFHVLAWLDCPLIQLNAVQRRLAYAKCWELQLLGLPACSRRNLYN